MREWGGSGRGSGRGRTLPDICIPLLYELGYPSLIATTATATLSNKFIGRDTGKFPSTQYFNNVNRSSFSIGNST